MFSGHIITDFSDPVGPAKSLFKVFLIAHESGPQGGQNPQAPSSAPVAAPGLHQGHAALQVARLVVGYPHLPQRPDQLHTV